MLVIGGIALTFLIFIPVLIPLDGTNLGATALIIALVVYSGARLRMLDLPLRPPSAAVRNEVALVWVVAVFAVAVAGEAARPAHLATVSVSTAKGPIGGYYLSSRGEGVFIGQRGYVMLVPTADIQAVVIHRALARDLAPPTLIERVLGLQATAGS